MKNTIKRDKLGAVIAPTTKEENRSAAPPTACTWTT